MNECLLYVQTYIVWLISRYLLRPGALSCGMAWHDKSICCTYEHINESTVWWRRHLPSTLRGQENWSNGQRICMSGTEIKHKMVNNKQITPQYILKFSKRFTHNVKCENLYHFRYLIFGCVHAKHFLCCVCLFKMCMFRFWKSRFIVSGDGRVEGDYRIANPLCILILDISLAAHLLVIKW